MPKLNDNPSVMKRPERLFIYGSPGTRKTTYAAMMAEAGFNVLFLDCDGKPQPLSQLSVEAKKRVYYLNIEDDGKSAIAADFLYSLLKKGKTYFDEETKKCYLTPTENSILIDITKLDQNTIIILDSYSALCWSLTVKYAKENKIELGDAAKTEWDGYGWTGKAATWMIQQIKNLTESHVVFIGHKDMYEKTKTVNEKQVTIFTKTLAKSVSGPHSLTLARDFSTFLHFKQQGTSLKIDARALENEEILAVSLPPKLYGFDELKGSGFFKLSKIPLPAKDTPYLDFTVPESLKTKAKLNPKLGEKKETTVKT